MARLQHFRSDIQGLRAVAIIAVVLFHAFGDTVPGGFVGVDVFFVISGFLITGILMREIDEGRFSIAGFYARRIRRLFPALFAMLAATLAAGLVLMAPEPLEALSRSAAWTALFAANIHEYRTNGYFAAAAELRPLLHAWSLGVEEQFYIAFPIFLAVMQSWFRRWLRLAVWAGALASLAWSAHLVGTLPNGAFYLPHSRAFELAIGALLALGAVPRVADPRVLELLSLAGLAMIVAAVTLISARTPYPGLAALLPCLGTAMVILAGEQRQTLVARLLAVAPMQFVGAISYSLYLWHWPVLVFARYVVLGELDGAAIAVSLATAFALAWLSYRYLEQPFLRSRLTPRALLAGGAGIVAATALGALALAGSAGWPQRFDERSRALFAAEADANPRRAECHYEDGPTDYGRGCLFGASGAPATVAVWADSFGAELTVALGEVLAREDLAARQLTASSCPPALGYSPWNKPHCAGHNRAVLRGLLADDRVETVVLFADYDGYGGDRARILEGLGEAARALHATGKRVVLVYPLPRPQFDVPEALGMIAWHGGDPASWGPEPPGEAGREVERFLDALAKQTDAAAIVPARALCSRSRCDTIGRDGRPLYFDDRHLSLAGARLLLARQPLPSAEPR